MSSMSNKILIVDDDKEDRELIANTLKKLDFEYIEARNGVEALEKLKLFQDDLVLIILDYFMPGYDDGLSLLEKIKTSKPEIPIIMISGYDGIPRVNTAINAINSGAIHVIEKSYDTSEQLTDWIRKHFPVEREYISKREIEAQSRLNELGFYSQSDQMKEFCSEVYFSAINDWNVLIIGETGTGKTLLAETMHKIHQNNKQSELPFVRVNCTAIPKYLFESELFGHKKGSFTGAISDKKGLIEEAGRGICFLDELTEVPLSTQVKLNHVVEITDRKFRKIGENKEILSEAKIIAATNRNLFSALSEGILRDDLIYRFDQVLKIPPLRDRIEDIEILTKFFLVSISKKIKKAPLTIELEGLRILNHQPWFGNARQLFRVVKRLCVKANNSIIKASDISKELKIEYGLFHHDDKDISTDRIVEQLVLTILKEKRGEKHEIIGGIDAPINKIKRQLILEMLKETDNNIAETAKRLGFKTPPSLRYWMKQYGLFDYEL